MNGAIDAGPHRLSLSSIGETRLRLNPRHRARDSGTTGAAAQPPTLPFNANKAPPCLKRLPRWAPWKAEGLEEKLKCTKVPKACKPLDYGLTTGEPARWGSFDAAMKAPINKLGIVACLGLCLTDGAGFAGIDLDNFVDAFSMDVWAQEMLQKSNNDVESSQLERPYFCCFIATKSRFGPTSSMASLPMAVMGLATLVTPVSTTLFKAAISRSQCKLEIVLLAGPPTKLSQSTLHASQASPRFRLGGLSNGCARCALIWCRAR